jgi:hypothetical protein
MCSVLWNDPVEWLKAIVQVCSVQSMKYCICLAFITEMSVAVCTIFSVDSAYGRRKILRLGCISDVSAIVLFFLF